MDACCGGGPGPQPDDYDYGPADWTVGERRTPAGSVPVVSTNLTPADAWGRIRMRMGIRRSHYRVRPGLYAVGSPDEDSPVLVSANYKLSFDTLRSKLAGIDAWMLVLDTKGINVWCAAGKGTFGTRELVERVHSVRLYEVVNHRTLILPQLGAPGVVGPMVPKLCGFEVRFGPVRAADLPGYLQAGMRAGPEMRRITFSLGHRASLTPIELSVLADPKVLAVVAVLLAIAAVASIGSGPDAFVGRVAGLIGVPLAGLVAGAVVTPILLPWIPGRAFALKGALVGAITAAAMILGLDTAGSAAGIVATLATVTTIASFTAMNFTGATTFTSPSGVVWEMRRALPFQVGGAAIAVLACAASLLGA